MRQIANEPATPMSDGEQHKLAASPAVQLPTGGGAIRSMGERFAVAAATGTASISVPLAIPAGRSGFGPSLALTYDSGAGNGVFGLGWSVSVAAISCRTDKGLPRYGDGDSDDDVYVLAGVEDLVPAVFFDGTAWRPDSRPATDGERSYRVRRYRARTEGAFARIERWQDRLSEDVHWRSCSPDNVWSVYGRSDACRIVDPGDPRRVFSWLLEESRDSRGNSISYRYTREDTARVDRSRLHEQHRLGAQANHHLKRILYGNRSGDGAGPMFEIVFDYGDHDPAAPTPIESQPWESRQDSFSSYRAGFEIRTRRLCRRVLVFHRFPELGPDPVFVHSTDLGYEERPDVSRLRSIQEVGYLPGGEHLALPAISFTYTDPIPDSATHVAATTQLPEGVDGDRYRWVDLDGDGIPGVLASQPGTWLYAANRGSGEFEVLRPVRSQPAADAHAPARQQLVDLEGDGRLHLTWFDSREALAGSFGRLTTQESDSPVSVGDPERTWEPFRPFASLPKVDWDNPRLRLLDLDGDGRADVMLDDEQAIIWHRSLGRDGFGVAEIAPKDGGGSDDERAPVVARIDEAESVVLADMTGDGLSDIVWVRNGEVCYWPNFGYGRFGAKVTMDEAPVFDHPDRWDPRRLRFADIDGTGTTDILYLTGQRATYWINQAGNSWSAATEVPAFPPTDSVSSVTVVDLLGAGTACLVWSSPLPAVEGRALRYVDLMGGHKPHLLATVANGRGGETRIGYESSTRFFLADREAGEPWATRLPFPVQVVTRVEVVDHVTGHRLISRYAYRHGCFDGPEREYRGFGRVDQWDAERIGAGTGDALDQPPLHTRTWYHSGVSVGADELLDRYRAEFWSGDASAWRCAGTVIPPASPLERRDACRALRGQMLRQELYADDGTADSANPYVVTERNVEARLVQPRAGPDWANRHAVCLAFEREALTHHYERIVAPLPDPRVEHRLTIDLDEFGFIREAASIAYPRRMPRAPAATEQARLSIIYTARTYAHATGADDWYRIGALAESRTSELTLKDGSPASALSVRQVREALVAAAAIAHEAAPTPGATQVRLLAAERILYYRDDLTGPLPLRTVGRQGLAYDHASAAFTPGLLKQVFGSRVNDKLIESAGYRRWPGDSDGLWWTVAPRQEFDPARFFLPVAFVDPWGARSRVEYDAHDLLVVATHDALAAPFTNTVTVRNNYRTLAPWLVTDPNGNRSGARFDALGTVTATVLTGKVAGEGDALDLTTPEASTKDDPTSRFHNDLDAWREGRGPCAARTETREQHGPLNPRWQEMWTYFDGLGRPILHKTQAAPGRAPTRGADGALIRHPDGTPVLADTASRWVGSGRIVLNNKGNPVRQYEPYFSDQPGYENESELMTSGVTALLRYDPLGRLVRADQPDGTFSRIEFDPWQHAAWDANDTVLASAWYAERRTRPKGDAERDAADDAAAHAATPTRSHLDPQGRSVLVASMPDASSTYEARAVLDVQGNHLASTDPRGNTVLRETFDLQGRALLTQSVDSGVSRLLPDVTGAPVAKWDVADEGERVTRWSYDALRRPTHRFVRQSSDPEVLVERTVYGERHPDAGTRNLRAHAFLHYDGAGAATNERYDFKGNALETSRTLTKTYQTRANWSVLAGLEEIGDIASAAAPLLEPEPFRSHTAYDALDRPTRLTSPDKSVALPSYDPQNLLRSLRVQLRGSSSATTFVRHIDYDAKGQRERIVYGAGALSGHAVTTSYTYDPLTFRLRRLQTTRPQDGALLQDLSYTFDPVGNIVAIRDDAHQAVFFKNSKVEPRARFGYDALYRLTSASGREHLGQNPSGALLAAQQPDSGDEPRVHLPHPADRNAMGNYTERYTYDAAGNIERVVHAASSGGWTRRCEYEKTSNRLVRSSLPGDPEGTFSASYLYTARGAIRRMAHLPTMVWDVDDQLHAASRGDGRTSYYAYDSGGRRTRKVIEKAGKPIVERITLGAFEIYREHGPTALTLERQTLHVLDGHRRIALVDTTTIEAKSAVSPLAPTIRYQLDNHLASATLELDTGGAILTYEEYYPYGSTSYQAGAAVAETSLKRYRFTGKERDDETGFYYHGARYFAPWLGRSLSCDPLVRPFANRYAYAGNNPVTWSDPSGMQEIPWYEKVAHGVERVVAHHPLLGPSLRVGEHLLRGKFREAAVETIGTWGAPARAVIAGIDASSRPGSTKGDVAVAIAKTVDPTPITPVLAGGAAWERKDYVGTFLAWFDATASGTLMTVGAANRRAGAKPMEAVPPKAPAVDAPKSLMEPARPAPAITPVKPGPEPSLPHEPRGGTSTTSSPVQQSFSKGPPATLELARRIADVERPPMNKLRTITLVETKEGPTIAAGGGSDLSPAQITAAKAEGLTPGPPMPGFDAEPTAIFGAGQLGLTPTKGVTTNVICWHCRDVQIVPLGGRITSKFTFEF